MPAKRKWNNNVTRSTTYCSSENTRQNQYDILGDNNQNDTMDGQNISRNDNVQKQNMMNIMTQGIISRELFHHQ